MPFPGFPPAAGLCKRARGVLQRFPSSAIGAADVAELMISFNKASAKHNDPEKEARLAAIRQISDWVESQLPEDQQETTSVMVNQIECAEEGCPPVECVIALLRKPKLVFKVLCPPNRASRH